MAIDIVEFLLIGVYYDFCGDCRLMGHTVILAQQMQIAFRVTFAQLFQIFLYPFAVLSG